MSIYSAEFSVFDAKMMARALKLANQGKYSTTPNPQVGCVIVNNNQIVGEGFHRKAGDGHAEINALNQAAQNSVDSTVYVTLEPCAHYGKTPPCALALINAKVKKVVIACCDPNPSVNGNGVEMLKAAGIEVQTGLMQSAALSLNEAFFTRMIQRRPLITVKLAASLDGKTALANGESQWITSPQARADVQQYRASACAILTGADTVIADNPRLNVRVNELSSITAEKFVWREKQPLRVVIDSQNRLTQHQYQMFNDGQASLVYNIGNNEKLNSDQHKHINQKQVATLEKEDKNYVNLHLVMEDLAKEGINHLWVEAGEKLTGALFDLNLVDNLILYQAPKLLGSSGKGLTHLAPINRLDDAINGEIISVAKVGPDIKTIIQFSHSEKTGN